MCHVLEVSKSGYYHWKNQECPSARDLENKNLSEKIRTIFFEHKCRYGSRRIRQALKNNSYNISRKRVCRLMKTEDLYCKTTRKFKQTTDSNHMVI
jgi:putative transposase